MRSAMAFHPEHTGRLAAHWAEALGGPSAYSSSYGDETTVVKIHSGDGEHEETDIRAIACFDQARADVGLANDSRAATSAVRLLRVDDHEHHGPLPPVRR
jgi:truncated hemoglobin YjbI